MTASALLLELIDHGLTVEILAAVLGGDARLPGASGQKVLDPIPVFVADGMAVSHQWPSRNLVHRQFPPESGQLGL
jgi:hypothetical protein